MVNLMKIYVDADACPVKGIIISVAKKYNIPVIMICDTSHIIDDGYSNVITVDKASDSADLVLANLVSKDDIAVTQDFGLAALICSKGTKCINQNGMVYDDSNLDKLLFERFLSGKVRRSGGRTKGPSKRNANDNLIFKNNFIELIEKTI